MARCAWAVRWALLGAALLPLGGCWDRVEIDERGFVVGVAVDVPSSDQESEAEANRPRMLVTYQIIKPAGLSKASGSGGNSAQASTYFNVQTVEESMPTATGAIAAKTGRSPFFEHLRLIVVAGDLARREEAFADLLDYFLRSSEMRREIKIVIADGKASDVLDVKSQNESYPVAYAESVINNNRKSSYIPPESRIGDVHEHFIKRDSFSIQRVHSVAGELNLTGAAIFDGRNNRLVGYLSGAETQGLNLIRNEISGGYIRTELDGQSVTLNIERAKRRLKAEAASYGRIKFTVDLDVEGVLDASADTLSLNTPSAITRLSRAFAAEIEKDTHRTIDKLRRMKQDAAGFGTHLRRSHYRMWETVQEDWNSRFFPQAEIDIRVKVSIRRIGNINRYEWR